MFALFINVFISLQSALFSRFYLVSLHKVNILKALKGVIQFSNMNNFTFF